jgi:hypothetical protein
VLKGMKEDASRGRTMMKVRMKYLMKRKIMKGK